MHKITIALLCVASFLAGFIVADYVIGTAEPVESGDVTTFVISSARIEVYPGGAFYMRADEAKKYSFETGKVIENSGVCPYRTNIIQ
uniref:Uncharacterized protein n=1 Tax=viral metagenome TaxID=1070528 RepID=A0A6M3K8L6_9ZZZZ